MEVCVTLLAFLRMFFYRLLSDLSTERTVVQCAEVFQSKFWHVLKQISKNEFPKSSVRHVAPIWDYEK